MSHFSHILLHAFRCSTLSLFVIQRTDDNTEHCLEAGKEKQIARVAPDGLPRGQFQIRREVRAAFGSYNNRRRTKADSNAPTKLEKCHHAPYSVNP